MNFLLRPSHAATSELPSVPEDERQSDALPHSKPITTLEGLIAQDSILISSLDEDGDKISDGIYNATQHVSIPNNQVNIGKHFDVSEDEGWITIPCKELHDTWSDASDIQKLHSLDRSFIFPGEHIHILVCLSASKEDTEIISPSRIAAVTSQNGSLGYNGKNKLEILADKFNPSSGKGFTNGNSDGFSREEDGSERYSNGINDTFSRDEDGTTMSTAEVLSIQEDASATESSLQVDDHKQKTESLLERFRSSSFFVRFARMDEPLWSKRIAPEHASAADDVTQKKSHTSDQVTKHTLNKHLNAIIDRGSFDGRTSCGAARNAVRCHSLTNGDIVVLLEVNVGITDIEDPVLEVLQFEKFQPSDILAFKDPNHCVAGNADDPCQELLNWLIPLDRALPPPCPLPPPLGSTSGFGSGHQRSSSFSSQIFSFSNFRSYSMPSFPQVPASLTTSVPSSTPRPSYDLDDIDRFSAEKLIKSLDTENSDLLSFRGVPLEPERFSVHCGLEGIYIPGRRWRRKVELVHPLEIRSFATECITEDLLCVQVKNISPLHFPDIIMYLDAITIIFEEASEGGAPVSLPISSIESGSAHCLPNLSLRRGEEHSFILKPTTSASRHLKGHAGSSLIPRHPKNDTSPNLRPVSTHIDVPSAAANKNQYAVLISCRCNYTESKLFFKKKTSWRPRVARDLLVSIASETTEQTIGPSRRVPQLPVQVLTLQASNLTSEDLTLTVLAPVSSTSLPSIVSLNSAPASPISPFVGFPEIMGRVAGDKSGGSMQNLTLVASSSDSQKEGDHSGLKPISFGQRTGTAPDIISSTDLGCTHLWLQSTVPLGRIPAHSSATVKLELLPLTDGIITLDTLQIAIKEKDITYKPEHPLKIYATSSIATGII